MTASLSPAIRVVVINYDGGAMTLDCLRSLQITDYPRERLEIVLVDNGSLDDVAARVTRDFPDVRLLEPLANLGFAGGCNLGIRAPGRFDHVALVNNDATVDPGWLLPLVAELDRYPDVGAACPKLLIDGRFQEIAVEVPGAGRLGADPRTLGVRVTGARFDGRRDDTRLALDEGFYLPERPVRASGEEMAIWSSARGAIRIRVVDGAVRRVALRLVSPQRHAVRLSSGATTVDCEPSPTGTWVEIAVDSAVYDVVNNVGSNLYRDAFAGDRGFLELDRGQYDAPAEVFAWCGGAVLLRGSYLREVGLFDERLFLYYEDTDLAWRGRLAGWCYRYVPASLVHHRHAQSSVVGSPTFRYFTERNRVLVALKNAPTTVAAAVAAQTLAGMGRVLVSEALVAPLSLRWPNGQEVRHRGRVLRSILRHTPTVLRDRARQHGVRAAQRRSVVGRWQVER
jgi:GT2 family glycosyltransferase